MPNISDNKLFEIKAVEYERGLKDAHKKYPKVNRSFIIEHLYDIQIGYPEGKSQEFKKGYLYRKLRNMLMAANVEIKK